MEGHQKANNDTVEYFKPWRSAWLRLKMIEEKVNKKRSIYKRWIHQKMPLFVIRSPRTNYTYYFFTLGIFDPKPRLLGFTQ